jgi:hypothetical protein
MHVRQKNGLDVSRVNTCCLDVGHRFAGRRLQVAARSGVDQAEPAARIYRKRIDRRAASRSERFGENLPRAFLGNVAEHVQRAVEEAVADRSNRDVADAAVVNTWNLLLRDLDHSSPRVILPRGAGQQSIGVGKLSGAKPQVAVALGDTVRYAIDCCQGRPLHLLAAYTTICMVLAFIRQSCSRACGKRSEDRARGASIACLHHPLGQLRHVAARRSL